MSSSKEEGVTKRKRQKEYNKALKAVESQLAVWQKTYEAEQQKQLESTERNLILAEFLYMQDRLQSVLKKQQPWLAGGLEQQQQQQQRQQQQQHSPQHMCLCDDAHWVIFLLETATWEHVQQALSMSSEDWTAYQRQYFSNLTELLEISKRCPEVQSAMLSGVASALQPLQDGIPAAYAATSSASMSVSTGAAANSNSSSGSPAQDPAAFDVIVHLLRTTGSLAYVALLHGSQEIFEAATRNVLTGEQTEAPPLHWVSVAQRMRFSREQKLHFKLALQNFARQAKAAAAQGLTILQQAPSYAFLLACEATAARQLSGSDTSGSEPLAVTGQDGSGHNTEAAAAGVNSAPGNAAQAWGDAWGMSGRAVSASAGAGRSRSPCAWAARKQQRAAAGPASVTAARAAAAAAVATAVAGQNGHAGCSGSSRTSMHQGLHGTDAAPAYQMGSGQEHEQDQQHMQMDGPAEELQRQISLYYRNVVNLNIFLADTLTLEQALMLNVASYPFWPMLSAVAEAAIQLPDEDASPENDAQQQGVQLLIEQRRSFMQKAHHQWFKEDGWLHPQQQLQQQQQQQQQQANGQQALGLGVSWQF